MSTNTLPAGPTLNRVYNGLLIKWAKECVCRKVVCTCGAKDGTRVCKGECEDCGEDLTGKEVYEVRIGWLGACCATAEEIYHAERGDDDSSDEYIEESTASSWAREREDFHADL